VTTPGQTVGPFFGYALPYPGDSELVPTGHPDAVRLTGRVLDGEGRPVPDALIEIRQTDADGDVPCVEGSLHRDGFTFTGWGRAATDRTGRYSFTTIWPDSDDGLPFIAVTVFARGLLDRLVTRVYLADGDDPLLSSLPPERRRTLVAVDDGDALVFDIRLQGPDETVFLDVAG
jgi:protocatechuate 3,4-dioxygenase alpha subunit